LTVYEHILSAIPHIRHHPIYSPPTPPSAKGKAQPFDSLIQLAAEGSQMIAGESSPAGSNAPDEGKQITSPRAQGKRLSTGEKAKPTTKCLGCGATETPEWRRGPMGPRTLCNACVSTLPVGECGGGELMRCRDWCISNSSGSGESSKRRRRRRLVMGMEDESGLCYMR